MCESVWVKLSENVLKWKRRMLLKRIRVNARRVGKRKCAWLHERRGWTESQADEMVYDKNAWRGPANGLEPWLTPYHSARGTTFIWRIIGGKLFMVVTFTCLLGGWGSISFLFFSFFYVMIATWSPNFVREDKLKEMEGFFSPKLWEFISLSSIP